MKIAAILIKKTKPTIQLKRVESERKEIMKAIYIKWLPATNTKPQRIKAHDLDKNSITLSRSSKDIDHRQEGARAAQALCEKMGWSQDLIGNGDVFLFADETVYSSGELTVDW